MKSVNLSYVFNKTVATLKAKGLWPDGEYPVDYALSGNIVLSENPRNFSLNFSVDFGGSEGIYVGFIFTVYGAGEKETRYDFGTIKTLSQSEDALAQYASLGAHFVCIARRELNVYLCKAFPDVNMHYTIYSQNAGGAYYQSTQLSIATIMENMSGYGDKYGPVYEGTILVDRKVGVKQVALHLANKARIEQEFPFDVSDIVVIDVSYPFNAKCKYSLILGQDEETDSMVVEYCKFADFLRAKEERDE